MPPFRDFPSDNKIKKQEIGSSVDRKEETIDDVVDRAISILIKKIPSIKRENITDDIRKDATRFFYEFYSNYRSLKNRFDRKIFAVIANEAESLTRQNFRLSNGEKIQEDDPTSSLVLRLGEKIFFCYINRNKKSKKD